MSARVQVNMSLPALTATRLQGFADALDVTLAAAAALIVRERLHGGARLSLRRARRVVARGGYR